MDGIWYCVIMQSASFHNLKTNLMDIGGVSCVSSKRFDHCSSSHHHDGIKTHNTEMLIIALERTRWTSSESGELEVSGSSQTNHFQQ